LIEEIRPPKTSQQ